MKTLVPLSLATIDNWTAAVFNIELSANFYTRLIFRSASRWTAMIKFSVLERRPNNCCRLSAFDPDLCEPNFVYGFHKTCLSQIVMAFCVPRLSIFRYTFVCFSFVSMVFWRFDVLFQRCLRHVGRNGVQHYQAVCRAWATEALELTQFLAKVRDGGAKDLCRRADAVPCRELDNLRFTDWVIKRVFLIRINCLRYHIRVHSVKCVFMAEKFVYMLCLYPERFSWFLSRGVIFEPWSNYYR